MPRSKFVLPTGYEDEQKKAETKRALAKLMLEKGLANNPNMQNWAQVLAQLAQTWAGKGLSKDADKIDSDVNARMIADYRDKMGRFDEATQGKSVDPAAIVRMTRGDPMMEDAAKPYADAMAAKLKENQEGINFGGQWRIKGDINPGEFEPNKPTDSVLRGPGNSFIENDARRGAALHAQGYDLGGPAVSTVDPMAGQQQMQPPPMMPPQFAPPTPAPGDEPMAGAMDLGLLSPEERSIMSNELARRAGHVSSGVQNDTHIPMGSPITARKAPAGLTTDGRPYWMVNGVAYDNPEGR